MNIALNNKVSYNKDKGIIERISRIRNKKCARKGCNNYIQDKGKNKKYCTDPKCIAMRNILIPHKTRKDYNQYPETINVIIPKQRKLIGTILKIRCSAKNNKGYRCDSIISVPYNINRKIYPRYCINHSNEFKRKRFAIKN